MSEGQAVRVEYSTNNSGGSWWLKDRHWKALSDAGWNVQWGGRKFFCGSKYSSIDSRPAYLTVECGGECHGHAPYLTYDEAALGKRYMGAVATEASKTFPNARSAIDGFEQLTGMNAADEGCNCCGPPHSFTFTTPDGNSEYASGDDVLGIMYERVPSYRDAIRQLNEGR